MKILYDIRPYRPDDNPYLIDLVKKTPIEGTFTFINEKKHFLDRAKLFSNYRVLVADKDQERIGVLSSAVKKIKTKNGLAKAGYFFDLRVDPRYRRQRVAINLMFEMASILMLEEEVDLFYTLIDDKNLVTSGMFNNLKEKAEIFSPLYLCIFPIYKKMKIKKDIGLASIEKSIVKKNYHEEHKEDNYYTDSSVIFENDCYRGSYALSNSDNTFFSIWDEESIRREKVLHVPLKYRLLDVLFGLISPVIKVPRVPKPNQYYKTWYLFNIHAKNPNELDLMLRLINNNALEKGMNLVIIPMLPDELFPLIKKKAFSVMKMNLAQLMVNEVEFDDSKNNYFDIRDI